MNMKKLHCHIMEELEGAEEYVHLARECKEKGHTKHMEIFRDMAKDELKHSELLMEIGKDLYNSDENDISEDLYLFWRGEAEELYYEVKYYLSTI